MTNETESEKLAFQLQKFAADGLVDIKFCIRNAEESAEELVCREVNMIYDAIERNEYRVLDFQDSN
jgi:hypothetical protein